MANKFKVCIIDRGRVPTKAYNGDAGWDLYAIDNMVIAPGKDAVIRTGISMVMPSNVYGRICPRSGIAVKHHINVHAGVIDSGFRGEIKVVLFNHGEHEFYVKPGDKVAQIIFSYMVDLQLEVVSSTEPSDRGDKGFGSSF